MEEVELSPWEKARAFVGALPAAYWQASPGGRWAGWLAMAGSTALTSLPRAECLPTRPKHSKRSAGLAEQAAIEGVNSNMHGSHQASKQLLACPLAAPAGASHHLATLHRAL